jgi:hypothetical protein
MHSVKYDAGRMLYGRSRPSEIGSIVRGAAFQERFPGATFNDKDVIDFQGALSDGARGGTPVRRVDVLKAADAGGDTSGGLWWGDLDNAPVESGAAPPPVNHAMNPVADNTALMRILAELTATANDRQSPAEREALLALLQGV